MTELDRLLADNRRHLSVHAEPKGVQPRRRLAVVTCMDARIDPLAVLGLERGDAHVLRNAGARLTDDVLRSLVLSVHLLGVRTVVVMQHTQCALTQVTNEELRLRTGTDLDFHPIDDQEGTLREDVNHLAASALLSPLRAAAGLLLDIQTGAAEAVIRWSRED